MATKSVLIQLSESDLETLIFDCVDKAIKLNQLNSTVSSNEIGGIELAKQITRLSLARIYTLVSERAIPHAKRGNRLYFNRAELLKWVEQGNRQTVSQIDADVVHLNNCRGGRKSA